jgi:hypothetical protein
VFGGIPVAGEHQPCVAYQWPRRRRRRSCRACPRVDKVRRTPALSAARCDRDERTAAPNGEQPCMLPCRSRMAATSLPARATWRVARSGERVRACRLH